jgi:zinc transporter ZupT
MIHLTKDMDTNASFALTLSVLAGLSTAIGGIIAIFMCRPKCWHLALILGFSAGVMLYISFAELLTKAVDGIGLFYANIAFFIGIVFIAVLDFVISHEYEEERVRSAIPSLASRLSHVVDAEANLSEFCQRIRQNLENADIQDKRLALDALDIRIKASAQSIDIKGVIPIEIKPMPSSADVTTIAQTSA